MITVSPLRGYRPDPASASKVACVPYDVIDTARARILADGNPMSFLRVVRSELELPDDTDPYADVVYERAKENLAHFIEQRFLVPSPTPAYYLYRLQMGAHQQTGIFAAASVDDYDAGRIRIHEKTRPDKENDRTRHILTLRAHAEPVFLAFRSQPTASELIKRETSAAPLYRFTSQDGIQHTVWTIASPDLVSQLFESLPECYIADGHHRAAAASRARATIRDSNRSHSGSEPYNFFPAVFFPHDQLRILPYNRIVLKLPAAPEQILRELQQAFELAPCSSPAPHRAGEFCMYLGKRWYGLRPRVKRATSDPVEALDISLLAELALTPIFKIIDQRTDKNIDFVGGILGTAALEDAVKQGRAECAFSLFPVSIDQLFAVADRGLMMAPKSTWFEPKLRSGLFVQTF